jgi:hypothetical protein
MSYGGHGVWVNDNTFDTYSMIEWSVEGTILTLSIQVAELPFNVVSNAVCVAADHVVDGGDVMVGAKIYPLSAASCTIPKL